MKNKFIIAVLLILLAISLILNGLLLLKRDSIYIKVPGEQVSNEKNSYECTKTNTESNQSFEENNIFNINFDKFGTVSKIIVKYEWKYSNTEEYSNNVKLYKEAKDGNYTFDDKNKIITSIYEDDYSKIEDKKDELWVKNIINSYISEGYTCNLK